MADMQSTDTTTVNKGVVPQTGVANKIEEEVKSQTNQMGSPFGLTTLLTKDGVKTAQEVLAGKRAIGLYFSAHWCPPCKQFTPILSAFYSGACPANDMEIIFVSSDRDQTSFEHYYETMPFVALPYDQRDKKKELSDLFDVSGIPAFIIVDADGNIKSLEGRSDIMQSVGGVMRARFGDKKEEDITEDDVKMEFSDTENANFAVTVNEWITKEIYTKPEFFGIEELHDGTEVKPIGDIRDNATAFAFYFSASWCPPCRSFTPMLIELYNNTRETGLEIIFVGLDQTEEAHNKYFAKMPWTGVPWYGEESDKEDPRQTLTQEFKIRGIPHLAITDRTGKIVDTQGVRAVRGLMSKNPTPNQMQAIAKGWVAKCQ